MTLEERAWMVAEKAHANQSYDIYPYTYHLKQVHAIAVELGYDESIRVACILHDALEDTDLSYNDIKKAFGEEIAEIVYCVTDELGRNRKERKFKTLKKTRKNWKAIATKICDRIANMRQAKNYQTKLYEMYCKESKDFVSTLTTGHNVEELSKAWKLYDETREVI